jgi:hypothetical protein
MGAWQKQRWTRIDIRAQRFVRTLIASTKRLWQARIDARQTKSVVELLANFLRLSCRPDITASLKVKNHF